MKKLMILAILGLGSLIAQAGDKPTYPGGDTALKAYLSANTRYPEVAKENGVEGIVTVSFIVMPDGSLKQVKVVKLIDPDLEKEAVRVVSVMPAWIPAEKDGVAIEAPARVDVPFILE
ncbi:MAG: energy transducer TonB [Muribaculaceae bacterium]|nr:energy transducer TonB [Muribaculaceae bacterium]